jgi:hypothetical protein
MSVKRYSGSEFTKWFKDKNKEYIELQVKQMQNIMKWRDLMHKYLDVQMDKLEDIKKRVE